MSACATCETVADAARSRDGVKTPTIPNKSILMSVISLGIRVFMEHYDPQQNLAEPLEQGGTSNNISPVYLFCTK